MTFKNILKTVLIVLLLVSCGSKKTLNVHGKKEVIKERIVFYKDTVLTTPKSVTGFSLPIKSLIGFYDTVKAPQIIKQTNGNATAKLIIKKDTVFIEAKCDTIKLRAKIRQEFQKENNIQKYQQKEVVIKNRRLSIFKLLIYVALAFLTGYLIKKFKLF